MKASEPVAWEYQATTGLHPGVMNAFGRQGWELITVYPGQGMREPALLWKRALNPTPSRRRGCKP